MTTPAANTNFSSVDSSRLQIETATLASLISISQSMGQMQGEIAILKARGADITDIQNQADNIERIVINGDTNQESLIFQVQRLRNNVDQFKTQIKALEDSIKDIEGINIANKGIHIQNSWQVVILVIGALITAVLGWLGLK